MCHPVFAGDKVRKKNDGGQGKVLFFADIWGIRMFAWDILLRVRKYIVPSSDFLIWRTAFSVPMFPSLRRMFVSFSPS